MTTPAVVLHDHPGGLLSIAGLSVLERLIVAAHRAGCAPISVVASRPLPRFRRLGPLGIRIQVIPKTGPSAKPTLVLAGHLLVQAADLRRVLEQRGRLVAADGTPLPAGVLDFPAEVRPASAPFTGPDPPPAGEVFHFPATTPGVSAEGPAMLVADAAGRRRAERALWKSLRSASDGLVDRCFNRPVGRLLSKLLVHTPVTANQVSVVSILLGVWSGWWFARGDLASDVTGALLLQLSAIIDCTDGDLARVLFKESPLGKWLDLVGDQLVHLAVFAGIPLGLYRQGLETPWLVLGVSAVLGVLMSFGVVLRGRLQPALRSNHRLQRFIDATTNRDFSVLVLGLALCDALEWFVWAAAVGVHVFWMTALALQLRSGARA